jgi:hypothetical protein
LTVPRWSVDKFFWRETAKDCRSDPKSAISETVSNDA